MVYSKKNTANNAICGLQFGFDENALIFFAEGNYDRFSLTNFIIEVYTLDASGVATSRENMFVTSRAGNQFNIGTRAYEEVPIDDTQSTNIQQALAFVKTNTIIRQVISKKILDDIQDEIIDIETNYATKTEVQNQNSVYGATSTGNDSYAITLTPAPTAYTDLKGSIYFLADVGNTGIATLNINGLGAKTIKKLHDVDLETGDIEASSKIEVVYNSIGDYFEMVSQVQQLVSVDTPATISTFVVGEDITIGNALYVSNGAGGRTSGRVYKTIALYTTYSDAGNFIGFATETITSGNNIKVNTDGINSNQSGLTIGSEYFLSDTPGIISTTPGTNIVSIGKAVSATGILINTNGNKTNNSIGTITTGLSFGVNTLASVSGIVSGYVYRSGSTCRAQCYVGNSSPAGTLVMISGSIVQEHYAPFSFPVGKGKYWRVDAINSPSATNLTFTPNI